MTSCISSMRAQAQSIASALLFLSCSAAVHASDMFSGTELTIPAVAIGSATFSNMVVTPKSILSRTGGTPIGTEDTYDPANNELFIPSVVFEGNTYTNVLITVGQLVSVGGVTGAGPCSESRRAAPKRCSTLSERAASRIARGPSQAWSREATGICTERH